MTIDQKFGWITIAISLLLFAHGIYNILPKNLSESENRAILERAHPEIVFMWHDDPDDVTELKAASWKKRTIIADSARTAEMIVDIAPVFRINEVANAKHDDSH